MGPLGGFPLWGFLCFGGGFEHELQQRMGVTEEIKSIEMRRRAVSLVEDSIFVSSYLSFFSSFCNNGSCVTVI